METKVYSKPTNTGQYVNFLSFTPWRMKVAWIKALYDRGKRLCSGDFLFSKHLKDLKQKMSWNGYPQHIRASILKHLANKMPRKQQNTEIDEDAKTIWIRLPYMGNHGESLTKKLIQKIRRCLKSKSKVNFKVFYENRKISSFCSTKDKIPINQTSNVIYKIVCPGCGESYIGKSERCFGIRMSCQGSRDNEPMYRHLNKCEDYLEYCKIFAVCDLSNHRYNITSYILNTVLNNSEIIRRFRNPFQLAFLESYYIKLLKPKINVGIAASKELVLFK